MVTTRSWLFCPGDRVDRLGKAAEVADTVVADLEDAVPIAGKSAAREAVAGWLREHPEIARRVWVRVNNDTSNLDADLAAVGELDIAGVMLPKAELSSLDRAATRTSAPLFALVETAAALWQLREMAELTAVHTIGLGEYDLAADLGAASPDVDTAPLAWARAQVVAAAAAARLAPPPAPVSATLDDPEGFRDSTAALQRTGFFGRMCIHPRQVALTHEVMAPEDAEVAAARDVVRAAETATREGKGVVVVAGHMVDLAVVRRARQVLALADDTRTR